MKDILLEGGRRIDDNGVIMPWYTDECLKWLEKLDLKGKHIFEYGLGDSTLWYKSMGAECYGVESNPQWYNHVVENYCTCNTTDLAPFGECLCSAQKRFKLVYNGDEELYIDSIFFMEYSMTEHSDLYDIIIIDGLYRDKCINNAIDYLKNGGCLILDNWKQREVEPEWPITEKAIEYWVQKVHKDSNHEYWQTLVAKE